MILYEVTCIVQEKSVEQDFVNINQPILSKIRKH